jgi:flavin-dependent dehydrogenase
VMRDQFDNLLAQAAMQAGAHLHPATPILDVTIAADHVRVRTAKGEATARYIVAADGVTSFVARRAGFAELSHVIPALEAEISVPPEDFERFSDAARFDFGFVPFGYAWVFPKRAHLSIGVLTTRKGSCNLNDQLARYLQALGLNRTLGEQRHGYMIPMAPRPDLFHQPRVLLVGDAAGLADPVLAEGISEAVLTGQLAADAIAEDLSALSSAPSTDSDAVPSQSGATAVQRYEQKLKSALLPELKVARFLSRSLYEMPRLRAFALKRQGRRLSEYVTDVVGGTATYRDAAFSPKSYWRLLVS